MDYRSPVPAKNAFTLIELSIVLAIFGLIIGGILAGKGLVRSSQLRKVADGFTNLETSINSFRSQYQGLPGDIINATNYWGVNSGSSCGSMVIDNTYYPGTCNGDGNGLIDTDSESYMSLMQLELAGLIEGHFSGHQSTGGNLVLGFNAATSPITKVGYKVGVEATYSSTANLITLGAPSGFTVTGAALLPEEAMNIDVKLDDGLPASGKLMSYTGTGNVSTCVSGTAYTLANGNPDCALSYQF